MSNAYKTYASQDFVEENYAAKKNLASIAMTGSWNDLTDKPFDSENVLIEWDGDINADNQVVVPDGSTSWFVKVSDSVYTPEEIRCLSRGRIINDEYEEFPVSELSPSGMPLNSDNTLFLFGSMILVAYEANATSTANPVFSKEITLPERGIYFAHTITGSHDFYVTHLSGTILKQIDEKYIPDSLKTHGVIGTEDGEVVLEPVSVEGGTILTDPFEITLEAGKTYSVAVDDDKYICECTVIQGTLAIGDAYSMTSPPFVITIRNGTVQAMINAAGTHTISVVELKVIVKTIDEKFIPDTIQRVGGDVVLNSSTDGSTKRFKITVDDSGTITATEITG